MSPQINEIDRQIKEASRAAFYALTLDEKLDAINQVKVLREQRKAARRKEIARDYPGFDLDKLQK
jgi:hypothetical protein